MLNLRDAPQSIFSYCLDDCPFTEPDAVNGITGRNHEIKYSIVIRVLV